MTMKQGPIIRPADQFINIWTTLFAFLLSMSEYHHCNDILTMWQWYSFCVVVGTIDSLLLPMNSIMRWNTFKSIGCMEPIEVETIQTWIAGIINKSIKKIQRNPCCGKNRWSVFWVSCAGTLKRKRDKSTAVYKDNLLPCMKINPTYPKFLLTRVCRVNRIQHAELGRMVLCTTFVLDSLQIFCLPQLLILHTKKSESKKLTPRIFDRKSSLASP